LIIEGKFLGSKPGRTKKTDTPMEIIRIDDGEQTLKVMSFNGLSDGKEYGDNVQVKVKVPEDFLFFESK
jgi:hypothetical protein